MEQTGHEDIPSHRSEHLLVFGEVLFDLFPEGRSVLGGAPFNVAWGLRGLGQEPLLISAVGDDQQGTFIRERMKTWGMRTEGLQCSGDLPTGEVNVTLTGGQPSYDICHPRAWDNLADDGWVADGLIYHGLLALRDETNRTTLKAILDRSPRAVRFFDINLRPPYDDPDLLKEWIVGANWLKLNLDELAAISGVSDVTLADCQSELDDLRDAYDVDTILLTAGRHGARIYGEYGDALCSPAAEPARMVDTVGAGDSFSAVVIDGILRGRPAQPLIEAADRFAAKICGLRGATTEDSTFYQVNEHE